MTEWVAVVETATYLATAESLLSEEDRTAIITMIAQNPKAGDLMPETGGLRKLRIPLEGRGKRGGGRLITFFHDSGMPIFLIAL